MCFDHIGGNQLMSLTLGMPLWCFLVLSDFLELNSREEEENEQLRT